MHAAAARAARAAGQIFLQGEGTKRTILYFPKALSEVYGFTKGREAAIGKSQVRLYRRRGCSCALGMHSHWMRKRASGKPFATIGGVGHTCRFHYLVVGKCPR